MAKDPQMGKWIIAFFISFLAFRPLNSSVSGPSHLKRIDTLPRETHSFYFGTTPKIAVHKSGLLFAVDNRVHEAHRIDLIHDDVETIAKKGQGPGELQLPFHCAVSETAFFIVDQTGVKVYDLSGRYLYGFNPQTRICSIGADKERVYLVQPEKDDIIKAYSYTGEIKAVFGFKYEHKESLYKGWPTSSIDSFINDGDIIIGQKNLFFISKAFSELFVFDFSGRLLKRKVIDPDELVKESQVHYFVKGQHRPADWSFYTREIISDGCYFNGNLYLIRKYRNKENQWDVALVIISEDNIDSVRRVPFEPNDHVQSHRVRSIAVGGPDPLSPNIYIALYDETLEEPFIKVFKEVGNK